MIMSASFWLLSAVAVSHAQVYTVTQWPSMCSAIYTSGSFSVTVTQSTTSAVSTQPALSDYAVNAGQVPFVIRVDQPTPYGYTTSQPEWLMANGNTTTDGTQAEQYILQQGVLQTIDGQYISTDAGLDYQVMAVSPFTQDIQTTIMCMNGLLMWSNPAFPEQGQAQFYKVPLAPQDNSQVIAWFSGDDFAGNWAPCVLRVRPVTDANPAAATYSIPGDNAPTSTTASFPPVASSEGAGSGYPQQSMPLMSMLSSSTSMWNSLSLSTVTALGSPIGPIRSIIYTSTASTTSTSTQMTTSVAMSSPVMSPSLPPVVYPSMSMAMTSSSMAPTLPRSILVAMTSAAPTTSSVIQLPTSPATSSLPAIYAQSSPPATSASSILSSIMNPTATSTTMASYTGYACPGVNGRLLQDAYGVSYIIGCNNDTTYGDFNSYTAANGWNDCFEFCHRGTTTDGTGKCTAFTYKGFPNGVGQGTCFLKNNANETFIPSDNTLVSAIQLQYYGPANGYSAPPPQSSSTSSAMMSMLVSSSSTAMVAYSQSSSVAQVTTTTSRSTSLTVSSSQTLSSSVLAVYAGSTTTSSPIVVTTTTTTSYSSTASSSSSSRTSSSSTSAYLVLASPTPCNFGDPAGTDQDDSYCEIDLPSSMRMYSMSSTQTFASTNGFISLMNGSSQYQTSPLPYSYIPNSTVLPLMDDLYLYGKASPAQGIFYQANTSAVTYEYYIGGANNSAAIAHFTMAYTFAVPGVFTYTYYNVLNGANGNTSSVGMQGVNSAGVVQSKQYSYQTASIFPNMVLVCDTNQNTCSRTQ